MNLQIYKRGENGKIKGVIRQSPPIERMYTNKINEMHANSLDKTFNRMQGCKDAGIRDVADWFIGFSGSLRPAS